MSTTLQFISTGGAFDYEIGNSAAWVTHQGQQLLLDCGHTVYPRLRTLGLADRMDAILVTHLHDDHVGSLSTLIFHQKHIARNPNKVKLIVPTAVFAGEIAQLLNHSQQDCTQNVEFISLADWAGGTAGYIDTYGLHSPDMRTHAYWFDDGHTLTVYSGDLGTFEPIRQFLATVPAGRHIRLFCDVAFNNLQKAHIYYEDLNPLADQYDLVGYHHDHRMAPADCRVKLAALEPGLGVG